MVDIVETGLRRINQLRDKLATTLSYVKVWNDKGFSWNWGPTYPSHPLSGEVNLSYSNTFTWTHTEVCWVYATRSAGWTSLWEVNMKTLKKILKILRYVKRFLGAIGGVDLQLEIED